jgi:hypothetical protein
MQTQFRFHWGSAVHALCHGKAWDTLKDKLAEDCGGVHSLNYCTGGEGGGCFFLRQYFCSQVL